tara:strand:- start:1245 stop:1592 length:348 start_codon:yes stop_codon:yes gene_type:complete
VNAAEIRPATRDDILAFYGRLHDHTVRAWVGILDEKIIGLGGVLFYRGSLVAFAEFTEEARRFPVTLVKACRAAVNSIGRAPIYAVPETGRREEIRLFEILGFRRMADTTVWRKN